MRFVGFLFRRKNSPIDSHPFRDKAREMDGARCLNSRTLDSLTFNSRIFKLIAGSIGLGLVLAGSVGMQAKEAAVVPVVIGPSGGKVVGWDAASVATPETSGPGAVIELDFTNSGLSPSHWILTLNPDGTGHFWSEKGDGAQAAAGGQPPPTPAVDRDIKVSAEFARHVFEEARSHRFFAEECESHMKVAFQGWKKLTYRGPDGQGSCGFNYSKDGQLEELGESLVAVAETILEGSHLEWLLRYDRLGLDREMDYVMESAADGRLQEFGTIRGVLEKLAADDGVLERVRKRARTLLARIPN
jgi:hypothetical protein